MLTFDLSRLATRSTFTWCAAGLLGCVWGMQAGGAACAEPSGVAQMATPSAAVSVTHPLVAAQPGGSGVKGLGVGPVEVTPVPATQAQAQDVPVGPEDVLRVVDTRTGLGGHQGLVTAGQSITFSLAEVLGEAAGARVPVSLHVTATGSTGDGFLTVHEGGRLRPQTSNVNYLAGQTVTNHVMVSTDAQGAVTVYSHASSHVVVDVTAVHDPAAMTVLAEPVRAVDTRDSGEHGRLPGGGHLHVDPVGAGALPEGINPAAVIVNVTSTGSTAAGFVSVYPGGKAYPHTSTINYELGQTVAGLAVVGLAVGSDSGLSVYPHSDTHLVVDVLGWVDDADTYPQFAPVRAVDTRVTQPEMVPAGSAFSVDVGSFGLPVGRGQAPGAARDVLVNMTVTGGREDGFLTAFAGGTMRPDVTMLEYGAGQTVAVSAYVPVGAAGTVGVYVAGATHVVVDVVGYRTW